MAEIEWQPDESSDSDGDFDASFLSKRRTSEEISQCQFSRIPNGGQSLRVQKHSLFFLRTYLRPPAEKGQQSSNEGTIPSYLKENVFLVGLNFMLNLTSYKIRVGDKDNTEVAR